jgi:hypothetical protein
MWFQSFVDKHTPPLLPAPFLQRERYQVAESAFWQNILAGKEAIIARQRVLSAHFAGSIDEIGTQLPCLPRRNLSGKKYPDMCALARAGDFQGCWYVQIAAGFHQGEGILAPTGFVKIGRQKMAVTVGQKRIDTNCMFSGKMVVDHFVGDRSEQSFGALAALCPWFPANARPPLVVADR